jgi:hypothetical protein
MQIRETMIGQESWILGQEKEDIDFRVAVKHNVSETIALAHSIRLPKTTEVPNTFCEA